MSPSELLKHSPLDATQPSLDATPHTEAGDVANNECTTPRQWVASRFNARASDDQGRLIVWNTMSGAISVFEPTQAEVATKLLSRVGFEGELSSLGKYLLDRGFIVSRDVDEAKRFRLTFGQQHYRTDLLELILMASEDCNFRCVYCYEEFKRGTMRPSVRRGIKKFVLKRAEALRGLHIAWFGGEPLYGWKAIEDLAPFFLQTTREHELEYRAHMTTNGYLLTPDIADKLLEWDVHDFQITLDGVREDHDRKRFGRDGSPTFERIFANLVSLQARHTDFRVTLRTNFDQENHARLDEYLALIGTQFGGDPRFVVALHAIGKWGGPNDANLAVCGVDEQREARQQLVQLARKRDLNVGNGIKDQSRPGKSVCYAARPYNFLIGADGKVMKCTVVLDKQDNNIVGRITEEGDLVLNPDHFALWVDAAWETDAVCKKCYLVPVCQGISCPMIRINEGRRPCLSTKSALKAELRETLELTERVARQVSVPG